MMTIETDNMIYIDGDIWDIEVHEMGDIDDPDVGPFGTMWRDRVIFQPIATDNCQFNHAHLEEIIDILRLAEE